MGRQLVLIALLAAIVAVLVGLGVYMLDRSDESAGVPARTEVGDVLVARQQIPVGTRLTLDFLEKNVRVDRWPAEHVPDHAVVDRVSIANWRVRNTIYPGEPVFDFKLASPDGVGALPMMIASGMRAFTVRVDDVTGVSGFIVPESYVDVIGTFKNVRHPMFDHGRGETFSRMILEHVKVVASGKRLHESEGDGRDLGRGPQRETTVTLEVTPAQAEVLALAELEGTIHLALRGYDDTEVVGTSGISREELLGLPLMDTPAAEPVDVDEAPAPAPAELLEQTQVELIKGSERSAVNF